MRWRPETTVGWPSFRAWALCGALWTFPWFTFGTGIVTLPIAGWLTWALGRHAPQLRDAWGLPFGIGGLIALVGLSKLDSMPWWLGVGLVVCVVAIVGYQLTQQPRVPKEPSQDGP
jgi:hypothetical protein